MAISKQLRKGINELMNSDAVRDEMVDVGNVALAYLERSAPYDTSPDRDPTKPHYRDNLSVEVVYTDRAVARVVADVPHAMGVEANQGLLKKAARAAR